jgi:FAD/FMN-containing dehydrogenase
MGIEAMSATAIHENDAADFAAAVDRLRSGLRGEVLTENEDGFDSARAVWNAMIDRRPRLIVRCKGAVDVMDAVNFARDHNLPASIRGGGHNVAGHAVCDGGVMIDLSLMRSVWVDPQARRARVEGGCTWGDVDRETQAFGLATPGGLISDTGVAGLTLAGGIGWLRSRYGLCIDNMVSADVVTADGRLVTASLNDNPELFWALRGGGGNFGVVVSFEFALHLVGPTVMFAAPIYPLSAGAGPIRFWRDFLADKHGDVGSLIEFSTIPKTQISPRNTGVSAATPLPPFTPAMRTRVSAYSSPCASKASWSPISLARWPIAKCRRCSTPSSPSASTAVTGNPTTWRTYQTR